MKVNLISIRTPEAGDPIVIHINPIAHNIHATWLGVVRDGHDLACAMRLMWDMAAERERGDGNEQVPNLRSRQPAD